VVAAKVAVVLEVAKVAAMVEVAMAEAKVEVATAVATEVHPRSHLRSTGREAEKRRLRSSSYDSLSPRQRHGSRQCCDHTVPKARCKTYQNRSQCPWPRGALHVCKGGCQP
jgi:hypothetical protein